MAIQRERLNRKNASGEYDTIHLETQADLVLMVSDPSKNVEQVLGETVAIAKGGTGGTTAAAGLYNLMAGLPEMTAEELAEDDLLCVLDVDANSAKKIALSAVGIGGGGTTNPELPNKDSLTLGNTVTFASHEWIVSHVTDTETYLTLKGLSGESTWSNLDSACTSFADKFTEAQRACLKSVTAGNTSGKVFVATYDQMDGGFSYFNSDSRRAINEVYWTSTEGGSGYARVVYPNGSLNVPLPPQSSSCGFRPSVCIDMSLYDSEGGGSDEPVINLNWPDKSQLTLGNTIIWANNQWIVSHVTSTEAYLTLKGLSGESYWDGLQSACTSFASKFTEAQKACLKSVTAGNTSGNVFVATKDQMDGGFSYFNSDSRRALNEDYWTSTEGGSFSAWDVLSDGSFYYYYFGNGAASYGFRPSVCIDLTLYDTGGSGGGSELNPELPDKSSLTVGNTVTFANKQWIVSHVTSTEAYLTLKGLSGESTWNALQSTCTSWNNSNLNDDQRACLKSVTAGNTSGIVFVATEDQMNGGFSYFNSDSRRNVGDIYWTSTESSSYIAWYVDSDGFLVSGGGTKPSSRGLRPSVCIDLTLYNQ